MMSVRQFSRLAALATALLCVLNCSEKYEYGYDSLYYAGPDGALLCRIPQTYNLPAAQGKLPLVVPYAGQWHTSLEGGSGWASVDAGTMRGPGYVHLFYEANPGEERSLLLLIGCDNGETVEISVRQEKSQGSDSPLPGYSDGYYDWKDE